MRILLMDDNEMFREMAYYMLISLGFDVTEVHEGEIAIQMYKRAYRSGQPFDVAILDLSNNYGIGAEKTISGIQNVDPDVKAIVSSGDHYHPVMSDYTKYGFKGALKKPYVKRQLIETIEKVVWWGKQISAKTQQNIEEIMIHFTCANSFICVKSECKTIGVDKYNEENGVLFCLQDELFQCKNKSPLNDEIRCKCKTRKLINNIIN
jgi:CheY-like chemotaxis protein